LIVGTILPHIKEELVAHEFSDSSQLATKASTLESFIQENEIETSNHTTISNDDYDVFDDTSDCHGD